MERGLTEEGLDEAQRRCRPEACAIQSCLKWRAGYDEKKCKKEIAAYNECVRSARESIKRDKEASKNTDKNN